MLKALVLREKGEIKLPESVLDSNSKTGFTSQLTSSQLIEINLETKEEILEFRSQFSSLSEDILFLDKLFHKDQKTLIVFDMDSTLIQQEIIDELARYAGVYDRVSEITEEAMQGKIDFEESLRKRCKLLKGLDVEVFEIIYRKLSLNPGVKEFLDESRNWNFHKGVISGGFSTIIQKFALDYGFDYFQANHLEEINGKLSGEILGEIIDRNNKQKYFRRFKEKSGATQTIAIGDGANDKLMLDSADLGIGFKPKYGLKKEIYNWVDFTPMDFIFHLFV